MPAFSIPTNTRLPSSLKIPSSDIVVRKTLARLSRASLISLIISWLDDTDYLVSQPYLDHSEKDPDSDDFYPPASSLVQLRNIYSELQTRKGSKKEVLERVLEGDWRHGLTLYQLAMADLQHLYDHPTSHKWSTHRIVPLESAASISGNRSLKAEKITLSIPRIHPSTFLEHLQSNVLPDVKAHFQFDRSPSLRMTILRIFIVESPYNTQLALLDGQRRGVSSALGFARTVYVGFPDNAPFIYLSNLLAVGPPNSTETKDVRALIFDGIRKALSKPRERYTLVPTGITTRNLQALLHFKGSGRSNASGGGWGIYAKEITPETPLDGTVPKDPVSDVLANGARVRQNGSRGKRARSGAILDASPNKRARLVAQARFGDSARATDGHGLERIDIAITDPFPIAVSWTSGHLEPRSTARSSAGWVPNVKLAFQGPHVFAGIRQLIEGGVIDGEKMSGWLTGEGGITVGTIRDGRMQARVGFEV